LVNSLRGKILGLFMGRAGQGLKVGRGVNIANPQNIFVGNNVSINAETHLIASNSKISIGNDVLIAPRCYIQTQNHNFKNKNLLIREQGTSSLDIVIGDDVWLAYGVILLPGVEIKSGAVVGACAIVTKTLEALTINVGCPAMSISRRD